MNLENFISPCNCFFSFSVQFPLFCQCTHKTFERQYMHSLSAYLLWETVKCCLGWNIAPCMGGKVFSTVRCECRWVISTLLMPISFSVNSALRMWMQRHVQGYVCMRDCPPCCKYTCKIEVVCESVSVGALYFLHWVSWLQSKQHELVKGCSVEGNKVLEQC